MARRFLQIIAGIVFLVFIGGVASYIYKDKITLFLIEPNKDFAAYTPPPAPDYTKPSSWAALPGERTFALAHPTNASDEAPLPVDVFFIHPTTSWSDKGWNTAIDEPISKDRLDNRVLKNIASAFNTAGYIYAPRYRQATLASFYAPFPNGIKAVDLAYTDVERAFDYFIHHYSRGRAFILVGHSQGTLHLLHLLKDRIAGTPLASRMIAAYAIGWPITTHDMAALPGIPVCKGPEATGCLITWSSFRQGADTSKWNAPTGLDGKPNGTAPRICVNPLNFLPNAAAPARLHLGLVDWAEDGPLGALIPDSVPAACDKSGVLRVSPPSKPDLARLDMTPGNMHVVDINLFYGNVRENSRERANAWINTQMLAQRLK